MALCGALGRRWSPVTPRHFAWHLVVLPGRRGTWRHPLSSHVAGVAQSHIPLRFAWQAWHNLTSTFVLRGRRGTYGTAWHTWSPLVAGDAPAPHCHAPSLSHHLSHTTLSPTIFHTRLCHTPSFTPSFTHHLSHTTLSHTIFHTTMSHTIFHAPLLSHTIFHHTILHTPLCHTPSFNLSHTIFHTSLCHTHYLSHTTLSHTTLSHAIFHTPSLPLCHTQSFTHHFCPTPLCHTPSFTHHFVTHHLSPHHLSHTTLSHIIFHHTIFPTQLCRTPSAATPYFTHHFATHHLSHTTLSPTIFDTPSVTHNFVTHTHTHLCHTRHLSLSRTIFHIQLCHTHTHTTLIYFSILHHLLCLSLLAYRSLNFIFGARSVSETLTPVLGVHTQPRGTFIPLFLFHPLHPHPQWHLTGAFPPT